MSKCIPVLKVEMLQQAIYLLTEEASLCMQSLLETAMCQNIPRQSTTDIGMEVAFAHF